MADHLIATVLRKVAAGEPAFVYGHPERRLGRFPEVVSRLAEAVAGLSLTWRVSLSEFARWWRWRSKRRWSLAPRADGGFSVQFEDWDSRYPLSMEIARGEHVATLAVNGPSQKLRLDALAYERREVRRDAPEARPIRPGPSLRRAIRSALDWETVTPLDDLPDATFRDRLKKRLRRIRAAEGGSR